MAFCCITGKPSDCHYLWMGPPPELEEYIGQDTIGPDLLRESYPKLKIIFWCLEEYKAHYDAHFKNKNIKVMAIEPFIKQDEPKTKRALLPVIESLEASAKKWTSPKDKARDRVSIKELIQYYLQTHFHGFFMDTNIIPSPRVHEWLEPPNKRTFYIPRFDEVTIDAWLMYSPSGNRFANERFSYYLENIQDVLSKRTPTDTEIDRKWQRYIFMATIDKHPYDTIDVKELDDFTSDFLSLQKRYHNSHRKDFPPPTPLLTRLAEDSEAKRELAYYREKRKPPPKVLSETPGQSKHLSPPKHHFFKWPKAKPANTQSHQCEQLKAGSAFSPAVSSAYCSPKLSMSSAIASDKVVSFVRL